MSFGRQVRVTVYSPKSDAAADDYFSERPNGLEITDLRVRFTVEKSLGKDPNTAEVVIINLNEEHRAEFEKLPLRVHLEAGYESDGGPRLLFVGDVRPNSKSQIVGTNWETKLLLGDGSRAYAKARINRSYKKGTPVRSILRDAAKSLGLVLPQELERDPALAGAIPSGDVVTGYTADELSRLLAPYGYTWSIQNGKLQVLRDEDTIRGDFVLDQDDGVLGVPALSVPDEKAKKKTPKLTLRHQLYPELQAGAKFELRNSRSARGNYKIEKVKHNGDTGGQEFETVVEAKPV